MLSSSYLLTYSSVEEERRKKLEEESRKRAEEQRRKREALKEAQQAELEREYEELQAVGVKNSYIANLAQQHGKSKKAAPSLNAAVAVVTQAVEKDNRKRFAEAYELYSQAVDAFAAAIQAGSVSSKTLPKVIQRMEGKQPWCE